MTDLATTYRLQRALSWTSSARTFVGQMPEDGQRVAVKILGLGGHPDRETLSGRFENTAATLSSLRHPALPNVLAHGVTEAGEAYLVLEWFAGARLEELALAPGDVLAVVLQLVEALESLALHGLVHLGVSPANVLVMPDHTAQLTGWGSSLLDVDWQSGRTLRPEPNAHTAPELRGRGGAAEALWRADLYSLASMTVHLLGAEMAQADGQVQVRFTGALSSQLNRPEALRSVLESCLDPDPDQRPDAYSALSKAVQHAMPRDSRQNVAATQPMPPVRPMPPDRPMSPDRTVQPPAKGSEGHDPPPDWPSSRVAPPDVGSSSKPKENGVQAIRQETGGVLLPKSRSDSTGEVRASLFEASELGLLVDEEKARDVAPAPPAADTRADPQAGRQADSRADSGAEDQEEQALDDSSTAEVVLPGADLVESRPVEAQPAEAQPDEAPREETPVPADYHERLVSQQELETLVSQAERRATESGQEGAPPTGHDGSAASPPTAAGSQPAEEPPPPPPPPPTDRGRGTAPPAERAAASAPSPPVPNQAAPADSSPPGAESPGQAPTGAGDSPPPRAPAEPPRATAEERDQKAAEATKLIARQRATTSAVEEEGQPPVGAVQPPPPVGVQSGGPPSTIGGASTSSGWSPLRIGLAAAFLLVLLLTGSLVAGLLRSDEEPPPPGPQPEVEPPGPVVEEPPPDPEPEPLPDEIARAAELVGEEQWREASELLDEIEDRAPREELSREQWEALRSVREALSVGVGVELAESLEVAIERLDVNSVRTALSEASDVEALRRRPGGEALYERGSRLLRSVNAFRSAMDRGEGVEPVETALDLRESYPDLADRLEAVRRSLARIEQTVLEQMSAGRYVEAQLLIDRVAEMVELTPRLSTLRRQADRNIEDKARLTEVLRQARAHGREGEPHVGLELLDRESAVRSVDSGRYDETREELRRRLRDLDGQAPRVSLSGEELELKRNETFVVELSAVDDYGVVEVRFRIVVDGGEALTVPASRQGEGAWVVEIPDSLHGGKPLQFWAVAVDRSGHEGRLASSEEPIEVRRSRWFDFLRPGSDDPGGP